MWKNLHQQNTTEINLIFCEFSFKTNLLTQEVLFMYLATFSIVAFGRPAVPLPEVGTFFLNGIIC